MSVQLAASTRTELSEHSSAPSYRLLNVITSMDPVHGGPPEGIRQLSKARRRARTFDRGRMSRSFRRLPGERVRPENSRARAGRGQVPLFAIVDPLAARNVRRFDCVIAHDIWQYPCLATWRALRHTGTPYFVFTHGMLDPWFCRTYPLKHVKKAVYSHAGGHRVLRDARAVFFTSEQERLLAGRSFRPYRCQAVAVGFGSNGAARSADLARSALSGCVSRAQGSAALALPRALNPKKGLDILIEAFARTAAADHGTQLVIAGPDNADWRSLLERQAAALGIANQTTWTGLLTDEQKWGALYASELFCLPSHQENFALGVAEALRAAFPL